MARKVEAVQCWMLVPRNVAVVLQEQSTGLCKIELHPAVPRYEAVVVGQ